MNRHVQAIVDDVEAAVMPLLRCIASDLGARYPTVAVCSYGSPLGQSVYGEPRGFIFAVDCGLPGDGDPADNSVALIVGLWDLLTTPQIEADVAWGSGAMESSTFDPPVPLTPARLEAAVASLPALARDLAAAIERGHP